MFELAWQNKFPITWGMADEPPVIRETEPPKVVSTPLQHVASPPPQCPHCKKEVAPSASVCPHCQSAILDKNPVKNALLGLIGFGALFCFITAFSRWQANRDMADISAQIDPYRQLPVTQLHSGGYWVAFIALVIAFIGVSQWRAK